MRHSLLLLMSVVLASACGDDDVAADATATVVDARGPADGPGSADGPTDDGPTDDGPTDAAAADGAGGHPDAAVAPDAAAPTPDAAGAADGGPGPTGLTCEADGTSFPPIDRTCAAPGDCAIGLHQFNCCGTRRAIGIRATEVARFDEAETACAALYPHCGCATFPTIAEDGRDETAGMIKVDCTVNGCRTYVP